MQDQEKGQKREGCLPEERASPIGGTVTSVGGDREKKKRKNVVPYFEGERRATIFNLASSTPGRGINKKKIFGAEKR